MASRSKAAYSERKRPKSTFILTVNRPYLSIIQGKENRLSHRPISSAKGTGGLNFLIADALLILCHSLFEVVIEQIAKRSEIVVPLVTVYAVIDGDIPNIALGKEALGIVAHFQIVPTHTGHILDNDGFDLSCLGQPDHLIPARTVKRHPGNAVVDEKCGIRETVVGCVLQKDFLLERDLSRVFFTKTFAVIYEFIFFNFLNSVYTSNVV